MNQQSIYNSTVFKIENVGPYYDTDFFSKSLIFHLWLNPMKKVTILQQYETMKI